MGKTRRTRLPRPGSDGVRVRRPPQPAPPGSVAVPAAAAFLTCFVIGVGLSALLGVEMRVAVPVGFVVGALVAAFAVARIKRE